MCGIIGYTGKTGARQVLLDGLYALEYRGYDSAGVCVLKNGEYKVIKSSGRVSALEAKLGDEFFDASCGIGHTRWATHGAPTTKNAHPHRSKSCVLVHNGIIENYIEIKDMLQHKGYSFESETDTECIVHLLDCEYRARADVKQAIINAAAVLKGSFAIAVMFYDREGEIWAVRRDNPLIAGIGEGCYIASDIPAIAPYVSEVVRPEDNQVLCATKDGILLFDLKGNAIKPEYHKIEADFSVAQKGEYPHFMLKEIYEQPAAVYNAAAPHQSADGVPDISGLGLGYDRLKEFDSVSIIGCGSATHAGLVGRLWLEQFAKIPVFVTTASEYRYCPPVTSKNVLTIAISQSGETADTLAALKHARAEGGRVLAIVNAPMSAIAREADYVMHTNAGTEIAVATTKGYTSQLASLLVVAMCMGIAKGRMCKDSAKRIMSDLLNEAPREIYEVLKRQDEIFDIAKSIKNADSLYYIGRGIDASAAIEASLKLKEISYIHSESYAAGELKHGTLSLIESGTPVIALACGFLGRDKMLGNIKEVMARGGKVTVICDSEFEAVDGLKLLRLSFANPMLSPFSSVTAAQLIAYNTAVLKGCDVDKPRNLAKSVTVE